jgi:hypothetical protein
LNNVLYGAAGRDFCSYGPLTQARYAGTDRGDIRDETCEYPSNGLSTRTRGTAPNYTFEDFQIDVAKTFNWRAFGP